MEKQVVARCILEILGAPEKHIVSELKKHVDKLKEEGLKILSESFAKVEPQDNLFTQFVELEIEFTDPRALLDFCFDSLPSSVEIITPDKIELDLQYFQGMLNDFQAKLHHADRLLKDIAVQKQVLDKNAINILQNFLKYACQNKPQTIEELSEMVGMNAEKISKFLEGLVERGVIKKEGDKFLHD